MVFQVPASKATDKDFYEFSVPSDVDEKGKPRIHKVPLLNFQPGSVVEALVRAADSGNALAVQASYYTLFGAAGTPAGDAVRTLDDGQIDALVDDYVEASKLSVGESAASTDS